MHEIYSGYSLFFDDSHIVIVSTGCRVVAKTCQHPELPCKNDRPAMTQIKSPFGARPQCLISKGLH
jgi:hypothetical protein